MKYFQYTNAILFHKSSPYNTHCDFLDEKEMNWIVLVGWKPRRWIVYAELTKEMEKLKMGVNVHGNATIPFVQWLKRREKKISKRKNLTILASSRKIQSWQMEGNLVVVAGAKKITRRRK